MTKSRVSPVPYSHKRWSKALATRISRTPLVVGAAIGALVFSGATPAFASSPDVDPGVVAEAVAAAAPTELDAIELEQQGDRMSASFGDGGGAALGVDATDGVIFATSSGEKGATVSLPGSAGLTDAVVNDDGSVTYSGDASVPSVNILAANDAVRVSTVIASAGQGEEFDYDFGADAAVEIQADGSALVLAGGESSEVEDTELILAHVKAPWATDASGAPVDTYYAANGSVLTQVVKHRAEGVAYPVVADPTFDNPNIVQYRVRFNRAETASIAANGWGGVIGSISCGAMAPVCALASGTLAYQAGIAQNSKPKKCVQVTATQPIVIPGLYWWVDTYSGGPCK